MPISEGGDAEGAPSSAPASAGVAAVRVVDANARAAEGTDGARHPAEAGWLFAVTPRRD